MLHAPTALSPNGVHTVIHWLRANYTIGRRVIPFEQNAVV